jgi:hypothetical protein
MLRLRHPDFFIENEALEVLEDKSTEIEEEAKEEDLEEKAFPK